MKQRTLITTVAMGLLVIAALGVVFTRPRTREAVSDTRVMMDTSIRCGSTVRRGI